MTMPHSAASNTVLSQASGMTSSIAANSNNAPLTTLDQCLLRQVLLKLSDLDLEALVRTVGQEHPNIAKRLAADLKLQKPATATSRSAPLQGRR